MPNLVSVIQRALATLPRVVRLWLYALIALLGLAWGVYQVTGGDWKAFVGGLIVALAGVTASSNVPAKPQD